MNNTKLIWTWFVILWLFIIVIFTKSQIFNLQTLRAENEGLVSTEISKKEEHDKLSKIKEDLAVNKNSEVSKYLNPVKEDEILNFIYSEVDKLNDKSSFKTEILNLSVTKWQLNDMQFLESDINLTLSFQDESSLKNILNILISNDKYKFFITSINYIPWDNESESEDSSFQITIPLKVFYK